MKFPFFKQLDSTDCGSACLRMIAKYHNVDFSSAFLRDKTLTTVSGTSFLGLKQASLELGFDAKALELSFDDLISNFETIGPCIVHWNSNHFTVIYKIKKAAKGVYVYIADPANKKLKYSEKDFLSHWEREQNSKKGYVLYIAPTERIYENEVVYPKRYLTRELLKTYLSPFYKPITLFVLMLLLGSVINLIFPFLTQGVVDTGIKNKNIGFIQTLLLAQLLLSIGQLVNDSIRSFITLHTSMKVSLLFTSDFLYKLTRLPISFFDVKKVGDIMQRIGDNSRIQSFLTGTLISTIIAIITFIVYSFVMVGYNSKILIIFIIGSCLYVSWIIIFLKKRKQIDMKKFSMLASTQSNIVQLVNGMQEIKLNNCEQTKIWEWEQIQTRLYKINSSAKIIEEIQNVGGVFLDQIKNIVISYMAAKLVVENTLSLGMMMSIQYIIGQLNAPLRQFIWFMQSAQDASISMERLEEVYGREDEESEGDGKIKQIPDNKDVVFSNVSFRYNISNDKGALTNVSFTLLNGKVNAIVGTSGSGKTTILKLLLGFYKPASGNILLGDKDIYSYSDSAWRRKCGVVMQEGYIFSDTIKSNIGITDKDPDFARIKYAATVANIDEFIESLPLGYDTIIGIEGSGISTGQKQRILLARAVYKNPSYFFLDEATNALDSQNEKLILSNLDLFFKGRTVMIIAHRLSTIKNADNIIVIDKGNIVETGTHNVLLQKKGLYYKLVKDQL